MRGTVAKRIRRAVKAQALSKNDADVKLHKVKQHIGTPTMGTDKDGNPELQQVVVDRVTNVRKLLATSAKALAKDVKRTYNTLNTQARANFLKG